MWRINPHRFVISLFSNNFNSRAFSYQIDEVETVIDDADTFGTIKDENFKSFSTTQGESKFEVSFKEIYPEKSYISSKDLNGRLANDVVPPNTNVKPMLNIKQNIDFEHRTVHYEKLNPQIYGQKLLKLCQESKISEALEILEQEMKECRVKPDVFCYNVLINACGKAGFTDKAFQLYNKMKKEGIRTNRFTHTGLFNACANSPWPKTDGIERCRKLRRLLFQKGVPLTTINYHAMIKGFGHGGDIQTAFQIADEMLEKGHLVSCETFNFLFQACLSDKEAGFLHALKTFEKMEEMKIGPSLHSYHLLLRCINECKSGDPNLTPELPNPFRMELPKSANENTFHLDKVDVIVLDKNGNPKDLVNKEKLEEPLQFPSNIDPRHIYISPERREELHSSVLNESPVRKKDEVQENNQFKQSEVKVQHTELSLVNATQRLIHVGGISGILQSMNKHRVKPNLTTFTLILDSLPNNLVMERELLSMLSKKDIKLDIIFCNKLIRRRCLRSKFSQAKEVFNIMQEHALSPDIITFGCLAIGCYKKRDITKLLNDMDQASINPNEDILEILMLNALKNKLNLLALNLLKDTHNKYGMTPTGKMISFHEVARKEARAALLNDERGDCSITAEERESLIRYLKGYDIFLKNSQVDMPEHPWKQYGFDMKRSRYIKTS